MLVMRLEVGEVGGEGQRRAALLEAEGRNFHITQASLGQINIWFNTAGVLHFTEEGDRTQVRTIKRKQKGGITETGCKARKNTRRWMFNFLPTFYRKSVAVVPYGFKCHKAWLVKAAPAGVRWWYHSKQEDHISKFTRLEKFMVGKTTMANRSRWDSFVWTDWQLGCATSSL